MLILDTCALVWLVSGSSRLTKKTLRMIDSSPAVCVSAISAWEISLKAERGQLDLPSPPEDWFNQSLKFHDLMLSPLTPEIMIASNRLPWHHRDPADRFIIATALRDRLTIVTADQRFAEYGTNVIC